MAIINKWINPAISGKLDIIKDQTVEGTLKPYELGNGVRGYDWQPVDKTQFPYFKVTPNIGYHFEGFEKHEETKEVNDQGQTTVKSTNFTPLKNFTSRGAVFCTREGLTAEGKPQEGLPEIDWDKKLFVYNAKFNKNVYNVVVENWFFDKNGAKLVDMQTDDVEGISVDIADKKRTTFKVYNLSERLDGLTHSFFDISDISNENGINTYLQARQISFTQDNNGFNAVMSVTGLRKSKNYTLDDEFTVTAKQTGNTLRYSFEGWYYKVKPNNVNWLEPLPLSAEESKLGKPQQGEIQKSLVRDVKLTSMILDNKIFKTITVQGPDGRPMEDFKLESAPLGPLFEDGQITLVAKWKQVPFNIRVSNGEGGNVVVEQTSKNILPAQ